MDEQLFKIFFFFFNFLKNLDDMCQSQTRLLTRVSNVALAETTEAFAFSSSLLFKKKKKCPHVSFLFGTDFGDFRL